MILTFLAKHWKTPHNQPLYFHFSSFCQCIYYTLLFISISFLYAIPEREKNYSLKSNVVASSAVVVCVFLVPEFLRFTHLFMCVCMCVCGCFYSHALSISLAFSRYFYLFVCLFVSISVKSGACPYGKFVALFTIFCMHVCIRCFDFKLISVCFSSCGCFTKFLVLPFLNYVTLCSLLHTLTRMNVPI